MTGRWALLIAWLCTVLALAALLYMRTGMMDMHQRLIQETESARKLDEQYRLLMTERSFQTKLNRIRDIAGTRLNLVKPDRQARVLVRRNRE